MKTIYISAHLFTSTQHDFYRDGIYFIVHFNCSPFTTTYLHKQNSKVCSSKIKSQEVSILCNSVLIETQKHKNVRTKISIFSFSQQVKACRKVSHRDLKDLRVSHVYSKASICLLKRAEKNTFTCSCSFRKEETRQSLHCMYHTELQSLRK